MSRADNSKREARVVMLERTRHLDLIHNSTKYDQNIPKHMRVMARTISTRNILIKGW